MDTGKIELCNGEKVENLIEFLEQELKRRTWKPADLARASGLPDATISRILNRLSNAGPDVCVDLAAGLGEPPEKIFRLAGLLPPLPGGEDEKSIGEAMDLFKRLPLDRRIEVLDFVAWQFQRRGLNKKKLKNNPGNPGPNDPGKAWPDRED